MLRVAINGFGRIGRNVLRALYETNRNHAIQVVAINEIADAEGIAHLLKYDTAHGRFGFPVQLSKSHDDLVQPDTLYVGDDAIQLLHEHEIEGCPWDELDIDIVFECTGLYGHAPEAAKHIKQGAKKVLLSEPGSPDVDATIIFGINEESLQATDTVISNGSCTTNCIVPVIQALDEAFGVDSGTITTIHSSMHDQQVIDAFHPDLRRTRAASQSIIPVDTRLAQGIEIGRAHV